ncbi:MAG: rRNA pseudouridine synthase [Clostridia bacterium]|nr:rRNA pseudouridine synthase [Clostridia bacterium]
MERLDKILANAMVGSRKDVVKLIRSGAVTVDGNVTTDPATKVNPDTSDMVANGIPVCYREHYHLMMNKPKGYICATEDLKEQTVLDLLPDDKFPKNKLFPAGRLDKDTEGFVFLTTDGKLAHRVTGPKNHVNKKYFVTVDKPIKAEWIQKFQTGIVIDDGYQCKSAFLEILSENTCHLTIFEGKFHQVKRMFEALGTTVIYLQRVQIGSLLLDEALEPGEYRELTREELELLEIVPEEYKENL